MRPIDIFLFLHLQWVAADDFDELVEIDGGE